jgi:hypothetical protein
MVLLPNNILKCMSKTDRASLGKAGLTGEETAARAVRRAERVEHNILANWLRLHDLWFWHARTDRRARSTVGTPDFLIIVGGACLPIELKVGGNTLSPAQVEVKDHLERTGTTVRVVKSAAEAIECVREWLGERFRR